MTFEPGTKVFYVGGDDATRVPVNSVGVVVAEDFMGEPSTGETIVEFPAETLPDMERSFTQVILTDHLYETE